MAFSESLVCTEQQFENGSLEIQNEMRVRVMTLHHSTACTVKMGKWFNLHNDWLLQWISR